MAEFAADGAGVGDHGDRLHAEALEGAHIGQHHAAIAQHRAIVIQVEAVAVLHQELAPAHDAEAGPHLVPELPLNLIGDLRQLLVAADRLPVEIGDHLLVRRSVEQVALMPVPDAQHFLPVILVAAALLPQRRRLDRGHQHFLRARGVLLLAHDVGDVVQHAEPGRQPGIDAGRRLPHEARPQHEPVGGDLRLGGHFLEGRDQALG